MEIDLEDTSVTRFREYLRIKTVHPTPDYKSAIGWLRNQAKEINLEFNIVEFPKPAEFAVWLTWTGKAPRLKSILLNSHIDVVPVDEKQWKYDPFAADKDSDGNIYARGTQDMKSVGVQYLEAIRRLKARGFVPKRTVHVSFVPDEELGGRKGMAEFVKSKEFINLNVGFGLDEGITSEDNAMILSFTERSICQVKVTAQGTTGHSLILHENTAAEKLQKVMNKMLEVRSQEKRRLESNPDLGLGDVTTINMTMIEGGLQINIVPPELSIYFDIRVTPHWTKDDVVKLLTETCTEAGSDVSYQIVMQTMDYVGVTQLTESNPWWISFRNSCDNLGLQLKPIVFPGCTDIRYVRQLGVPCLGFSPINNTPVRLHGNDEFLSEGIFLRGIEIYETIIWDIANLPEK